MIDRDNGWVDDRLRETTAERWQRYAQRYLDDDLPKTIEEWWAETFESPLPDRHEPGRDD